jgi:hypothetical protein
LHRLDADLFTNVVIFDVYASQHVVTNSSINSPASQVLRHFGEQFGPR